MTPTQSKEAPNRLNHVIGISWPRSGHHMVVRLLQLYFGDAFGYCDFYSGKPNAAGLSKCCGSIPCKNSDRVSLTKNHDFDLKAPRVQDQTYLIQYRDFIPSVVSNFELFVRRGGEDTELSFRRFASGEFTRYIAFLKKWVHSGFAKGQLVLNYGDFLEDPHYHLARIITIFQPNVEPSLERIADAIEKVDGEKIEKSQVRTLIGSGVHRDRDVRQFRYYKPSLFEELTALTLPRQDVTGAFWKLLGRPPSEENVLKFQGYRSREDLEFFIEGSQEYIQRQSQKKSL